MKAKEVVGAGWYLIALVPLLVGVVVAVGCFRGLSDAVERAPRAVVPGSSDVTLEAGSLVAYGETRSVVRGVVYTTQSLSLECELLDLQRGGTISLDTPSASMEYAFGGFAGQSMFALTVPHAGTYQLRCDGQGGPSTIAFIGHFGSTLLAVPLGMFAGLLGSGVAAWLVRRRRRRERQAIAAAWAAR